MKKTLCLAAAAALLLVSAFPLFAGGIRQNTRDSASVPVMGRITLSTTTSTQDSGLLDYLLPVFTRETGWEVDVVAVGSGAALRMGRDGDADVLLVHARPDEIRFVEDSYGSVRFDVMYNDFLVAGPALSAIAHNSDVIQTLRGIAAANLPFVSRGDDSGTHRMELLLWQEAGINQSGMRSYSSVGQGMGATLQMANEMRAFTLTDRATWLTLRRDGRIDLGAVCEGDSRLLNYYGVIVVNPARHPRINASGAMAFAQWMISDSTQRLIGQYGIAEYGAPLFTPNAAVNLPQ
ncbi:MAG: substrate-binding domain-containing protein [Treponema sp.]|nr:substrate-binding domain-containing protein [Treponema sp.]MCL2181053.1 substrate-binding domain-containing protein [Treponema sp.]